MTLPKQGIPRAALVAEMEQRKAKDANWRAARTFSLVYPAGPEVDEILHDACNLYLHENALNPLRFPSRRRRLVRRHCVGATLPSVRKPRKPRKAERQRCSRSRTTRTDSSVAKPS